MLFMFRKRPFSPEQIEEMAKREGLQQTVSVTLEERGVVDAGQIAWRHGMEQTGLRNLAGIFLGFRVPKGVKTTNWAAARLTEQQVQYAATDAWASTLLSAATTAAARTVAGMVPASQVP